MSIHITETIAANAAAKCADVLMRSGFTWLVWSVSDEGYKMAPASSHEAESIRRLWSETIAGTFCHPTNLPILAHAPPAARRRQAQRRFSRTPERRAYEAAYKRGQRAKKAAV